MEGTMNKMEKYVEIIKIQMTQKDKQSYKQLEELFADDEFKEVVKEGRIFDFIRNAVGNQKLNMNIVQDLIWRLENLSKEQPSNGSIQLFIRDLKNVQKNNYVKNRKIIFIICLVISVLLGIWGMYKKTGAYVLKVSPTPEEMSEIVREEFGITVAPEDITVDYEENTDYQTQSNYPLVALYTFSYNEGGKEIPFIARRLPIKQTEPAFDLRTSFAQYYILEQIDCKISISNEYGNEVDVKKYLKDEQSAREFAEGFREAMTGFFNNPAIAANDYVYYFDLYLLEDDSERSFTLELTHSTYAEQIEALSAGLIYYLKASDIVSLYESGEYTEEEVQKQLEKLEAEFGK